MSLPCPQPLRLAIFDLDNTLVDTMGAIEESFNVALGPHMGRHLPLKEIVSWFGPTEEVVLRQKAPPGKAAEVLADFQAAYDESMKRVAAYPGVMEMLERLSRAGVTLGLCTGKGRWTTECTLRHLGMNGLFASVLTGDDVKKNKPDPEPLLRIAQETGHALDATVMVGDALADVAAARAAGAMGVLVLWGRHETRPGDRHAQAQELADVIFERVENLDAWFRQTGA